MNQQKIIYTHKHYSQLKPNNDNAFFKGLTAHNSNILILKSSLSRKNMTFSYRR